MRTGARLAVELMRPDDVAWDACLADVPRDVYHLSGFHAHAQASGDGSPFLVVVSEGGKGLAWPYLLRPVSELPGLEGSDRTDVTSVYGYPGPLAWGCDPEDAFVAHALQRLYDVWREQRAVSAFTRFHPMLQNVRIVLSRVGHEDPCAPRGRVTRHGRTVSIDLGQDMEAIRRGYGRDVRRRIGLARRAGLTTFEDHDYRYLPTFARLYRETMERVGADRSYFFDAGYLARLRRALQGRLHLLVTMLDGDVAAAGLFTECDGIAEWHLVGSDPGFDALSPTKVLVDDAIRWARDRGNEVLHVGGGRGGREDSLFWFKGRFSPTRHDFHTGSWVLDTEAYEALSAARKQAVDGKVDTDPDYFPAYRAPTR